MGISDPFCNNNKVSVKWGQLQVQQKMHTQHGLERKGRAAVFAFAVIRGNELDQCSPRNHQLHLGKELVFSGSAGAQVQIKAGLLHGR